MLQLKMLTREGIPRALAKAERYRLLGQPWEAESIYLDVLQVEPEHPDALVGLLLALTDQFDQQVPGTISRAREVLPRLRDDYQRAYYTGIFYERRAKAVLHQARPGADRMAHDLLRQAMSWYDQAETLRTPGDDDVLLRWNACVRLMQRRPPVEAAEERFEPYADA